MIQPILWIFTPPILILIIRRFSWTWRRLKLARIAISVWLLGLLPVGLVIVSAMSPVDSSPVLPYVNVIPVQTHDNPQPRPFKGDDWASPCGTPLYAPITGVVVDRGFDGYVGPYGSNNSYIILSDGEKDVILLHGDYTAEVGQTVYKSITQIGTEASIGNSTGCHTDISVRWR